MASCQPCEIAPVQSRKHHHARGRCDAVARFVAPQLIKLTYQPDSGALVYDHAFVPAANQFCGADRSVAAHAVGTITPTSWDDRGPVAFTIRGTKTYECDSTDSTFEYEGEGIRN